MADPVQENALTELTYPLVDTDNLLVGRGGTVYRADARKVLRPTQSDTLLIPAIADFGTWVAQNSATATDRADGFRITNTAQGDTENLTCRVRAVPSGDCQLTLGCRFLMPGKNYHYGGMVLRESATGKLETFSNSWPGHDQPCFTNSYNSPTSFSGTRQEQYSNSGFGRQTVLFFRMTRTSSNLQWSWSIDGTIFHNHGAAFAQNNFLTTAPDQWGIFYSGRNNATPNVLSAIDAIAWLE